MDLPLSVYPSIADPGPLPPSRGCAWAAARVRVHISFQSLPHPCVRRGGIAGARGDLGKLLSCFHSGCAGLHLAQAGGLSLTPSPTPAIPLLKTGGRSGVAGGVCLAPVPSFSIDCRTECLAWACGLACVVLGVMSVHTLCSDFREGFVLVVGLWERSVCSGSVNISPTLRAAGPLCSVRGHTAFLTG